MKTGRNILSSSIWYFSEIVTCQLINFVIVTILARLLDPNLYGVVSLSNSFITIFMVFVEAGLGNALIQKKDVDEVDCSTILIANTVICSLLYIFIFFLAPVISSYYKIKILRKVLRVGSLVIPIAGIRNVYQSLISKKLMYKEFFFASLVGTILSGIIGIILAFMNYGVWSIVISNVVDVLIDTIVILFISPFKFKFTFSFDRFKNMFAFGWKVLLTGLLYTTYNKLYHLSIGKIYTTQDLAYYDKGNSLPSKIVDIIDSVTSTILFSTMSNIQDDINEIKQISKKSMKLNFYITTPILVGLFIVCEPLIVFVLTDKWIDVVPYIRVFCIVKVLSPFSTLNTAVVKALGKSDIYLKEQIYTLIFSVVVFLLTIKLGPLALVYGKLIISIVSSIISTYIVNRLINYSLIEQLKDILPVLVINLFMALIVVLCSTRIDSIIIKLITQVLVGIISYIILSHVTNNDSFKILINYVKSLNLKRINN